MTPTGHLVVGRVFTSNIYLFTWKNFVDVLRGFTFLTKSIKLLQMISCEQGLSSSKSLKVEAVEHLKKRSSPYFMACCMCLSWLTYSLKVNVVLATSA